jgi:hypothetical protein
MIFQHSINLGKSRCDIPSGTTQLRMFSPYTFGNLFTTTEMEEGGEHFVDPTIGVRDVLTTLQSTPTLF